MEFRVQRRWVPIALLSIIAPMSLLVAFRLTGVLREPPTPETIKVESVGWEMERPQNYINIKDTVKNTYGTDVALITASIIIHDYHENGLRDPYWGRDGIGFTVNVNATAIKGLIASIVVKFLLSDVNTTIYVNPTFASYHNVTVTRIKGIGASAGVTYIEAKVSGLPCSLRMPVEWVFDDQNLENHQLGVNVEVTYSNGETYQKIVVPIVLKVVIVSI